MTSPMPASVAAALDTQNRRLIPYEYQFRFDLLGQKRVIKKTVEVSIEAAFTAVSIGYGVIPQVQSVTFGPSMDDIPTPPVRMISGVQRVALGDIPVSAILNAADRALSNLPGLSRDRLASDAAIRSGIQINPDVANLALQGSPMDERTLGRLFRIAGSASTEIQFLFALSDEGSGRTFQSEPILNTASLGISNGERPFRHFSPPIVFEPRTTIGLEISEVANFVGELYVSLQGYKVLGGAGSPTAVGRRPHRATSRRSR
jgi:hypothetical protein